MSDKYETHSNFHKDAHTHPKLPHTQTHTATWEFHLAFHKYTVFTQVLNSTSPQAKQILIYSLQPAKQTYTEL